MASIRDNVGVHGGVRFTVRDRRGRFVRRLALPNLQTQWGINSVATWIAALTPFVTAPAGPGYIALGFGPPNILTAQDADFEAGIGTWAAVTNCAVAQSSTDAWQGTYSLRMTATSAGSMTAGTAGGVLGYPVTQTDGVEAYSYMAAVHMLAGSTPRTVTVSIVWYTSAGVFISISTGSGVSDSTSAWTRPWVYAQAPAGAAYAALEVTVASAGSSEVHYMDGAILAYAPDGPFPWTDGGYWTAGVLNSAALPLITDTMLWQERAGCRSGLDQTGSNQNVSSLIHTFQLSDPAGTFQEAGLFDSAAKTTTTTTLASAGATTVTVPNTSPAVSAGQSIYIATDPLTPPAGPASGSPSSTGGFLIGGQSYYYVITATNSLGESTVGPETVYTPPTGTNTNQITLTWAAVPGATGYNVYRGTSSGTEQKLASVTSATYVDNTNTTPSGAMPTSDTSGGGGEYAIVQSAAPAGSTSWTLTDFLLRSHPSGAAVTVFNGNLWAHVTTASGGGFPAAAVKTSSQMLTCSWAVTVGNG